MLCATAFTLGLLSAVASKIPQLDPARQHTEANTYVYAADGHTVLAILRGNQSRIVVKSQDISPWMKHAIVAIEDKRFYEHRGVDIRGMARAVWADVTHHGEVQGGSTITQQFVKNAYLTSQKTIGRKLVEAALAWQLEQKWTKDQILTAYLNTVYFGNGAYGVQQAAKVYFHHSAATMKPAEAALLAGIPEDPSLWDPVAHPKLAKARRNLVLQQLYEQGYLTHSQYKDGLGYPMPNPKDVSLGATLGVAAPYFANYVKNQLQSSPSTRNLLHDGLKVKTTLDMGLQTIARKAIAQVLPQNGTNPSVALVAIDTQNNPGAVLAMIGGANYHQSQFNLATQGERQPGSSFKPFVYATALKEGISPVSTLTSKKQVTINADGRVWVVNNYEGEALGPVDLDKALAASDNSVFSQLTAIVGPQQVADTAKQFGILTPLQGYFAIGLGAEPATPLDMARAYTAFADGGKRIDGSMFGNEPRAVQSIVRDGKTTVNEPVSRQVLSPSLTAIEDQALQGVVQGGTGTAAQIPGREVAGKTGTTENYGDAWFVGFTPQLVVAVWVGYPDKLIPMTTEFHGGPVVGGSFPAEIWKAFMTKALAYMKTEPEDFPAASYPYASPITVVNRNGLLERDNGICLNAYTLDFFTSGPTRTATCKPNEVSIPDLIGDSVATATKNAQAWPLTPAVVYKPAKTGDKVGFVVSQVPRRGTASAYDKITLVAEKSLHGVVPRVIGLSVPAAQAKLAKLRMNVVIKGDADTGKVVAQSVDPRTASAPGERIVLTVKSAG